ncbi:MAG: 4Fe-4S dicluster domain-containing protein [bacterium]
MNRRNCLKLISAGFLAGVLGCRDDSRPAKRLYRFAYQQSNYLRPPGALPETDFLQRCIHCDVCAEVCDRHAIQFFEEDFQGIVTPHTPYIVAAEAACDLCLECTRVCPTGALSPLNKMEEVKMGLAVLEENLCLPYINQGGCGACYTVCPLNAVNLDMQRYPKVIDEKCVGCGLCEEVCLQKVKAIRIVKT